MNAGATARSIDELTLGSGAQLEELVDRKALQQMIASFYDLFRVPIRVYGEQAGLLANAAPVPELYTYLSQFPQGRKAVDQVATDLKALCPPEDEGRAYECFSGARYQVVPISLDGRRIGKVVLGPFLPPSIKTVDPQLLGLAQGIQPQQVKEALAAMPRAREETVHQITEHLHRTLDLILFSGHKALLTSSMHLASVRESFRDLSEKNVELLEAYNRLKELDRLKNNFLATVSHELRTPLTSIIGYSEMLVEGIAGEMADEQREFVATIHEKGKQLLELISGLLDLTKLDSGTLTLRKEEVNVSALVSDVVRTLAPMALKQSVKLKATVDSALPPLIGDTTRLRQVLINLSDNALKFTPPQGMVEISAEMTSMVPSPDDDAGMVLLAAEQPAVRIRVADSGPGIPDDEKPRVFDAFYQVDSSTTREVGGTGLGLSIVQRLVEGHEGTVSIEDNQPTGAAFIIVLPLRHLTLG